MTRTVPFLLTFLIAFILIFEPATGHHPPTADHSDVGSIEALNGLSDEGRTADNADLARSDALQSPAEFLGYELGERYTPHHRVLSYMNHLAEHSDRVTISAYGESYQRRELVYLVITSSDNQNHIEEIRLNNLRMTGLEDGDPTDLQKAIVWLSYNVHGNETSSSEAAMKTAYELANPYNMRTGRWLDNTVVILDPMLNPDGRDRYVYWYKQMEGVDFNPLLDAREHHEPWPGGRSNHYYFDLNRDWAWQTQIETRQRVKIYQDWMPHVHVDFHEQRYTAPYYFAPAAEPFHLAITDWQREFQTTIGQNHMRYFDQEGWLYFTRQIFDLFYPSYGDTWPTFNGAIGMTYEQAGHSLAGRGIITPEGDTLTLADRLTRHHVTGLSTVEITSQHSRRVISEFRSQFHRAINNPDGEYESFIVKADNHPDRIHALLSYLDDQKIRYGRAGTNRSADGYDYRSGETRRVQVQEDDIVISAYQPQSQLVRVLFEPDPVLVDSLTYDITAWEAHYRFGLDGFALDSRIRPQETISAADYRRYEEFGEADAPYAYIVRWQTMDDARFLADILKNGVQVRFSTVPFTLDGQDYDRGTLVITRAGNQRLDSLDRIVAEKAQKHHRALHRAETGFVETGADFGSADVSLMTTPKVAMLMGEGTQSTSAGEVWHFFDRQLHYPLTVLDTDRFLQADLDPFDVLILPSGFYRGVLNEAGQERLRSWVRSGGRLVALGNANRALSGIDGFEITLAQADEGSADDPEQLLRRYDDRQREAVRQANRGSIFRIDLDNSHPLAFGYDEEYFSLKLSADAYRYLENGWNVGAARPNAHMSGFVGHKAEESLEHSLTFGFQSMGSGSVAYLIDDPLFRGFWENGKLFFVNAVFFAGE